MLTPAYINEFIALVFTIPHKRQLHSFEKHYDSDSVFSKVQPAMSSPQKYTLKFSNKSTQPWYFYVYQQHPEQNDDLFSLAWLVSETMIAQSKFDEFTQFTWEIDYSFVWGQTGVLKPGITFSSGGIVPCSPSGNNTTTFSEKNKTPELSIPIHEQHDGLFINDDTDLPAGEFSVGIGMSDAGTFVTQAGPGLKHLFKVTPTYYVAAGKNIKVGDVLDIETVTANAKITFPPNKFNATATLNAENQWAITYD